MARHFLIALAAICIFAVFVQANDEGLQHKIKKPESESIERATSNSVTIVIRIIQNLYQGAASGCLNQAANSCKQYYKNTNQALQCGRQYLRNNQGRCGGNRGGNQGGNRGGNRGGNGK